MTKNAFIPEYFYIPDSKGKNTPFQRLHVASTMLIDEINNENLEMLKKIIALFSKVSNEWSHSFISQPLDISQLLADDSIEVLLCFSTPEMVKKLHINHPYKGFQTVNAKKVIFLPEISDFSENQQAKKYLWTSIQTSF